MPMGCIYSLEKKPNVGIKSFVAYRDVKQRVGNLT